MGRNAGMVTDSYATGSVTGESSVGGLVGSNDGTVTDSYATGSVTGESNVGGLVGANSGGVAGSYATGNVTGDFRVAGLVGYNSGTVTGSYATESVTGGSSVGGLVGLNGGTVTDSYATGNVTGESGVGGLVGNNSSFTTVKGSYATGNVTGESRVGGLVGLNDSGTVTQSYWNTKLSGHATSSGGVGLTTAEMFVQGSFEGFDFEGTTDLDGNAMASVWLPPVSGQHFPHLRGVQKNGQVLIVPPRVVVTPTSAPFLLEHTLLPPTISGQAPVFSGNADVVATIDASTGRITLAVGVAGGEAVTITMRRGGNGDYAPISVSQTLVVSPFGGGTGSSVDPWQIRTPAHLNAIRDRRGESPTGIGFLHEHFILMNDLDFMDTDGLGTDYVYSDGAKGWLPIGHNVDAGSIFHQGTRFSGSFDGNGRVIRNLRIDRGEENYAGLFGWIDGGSIVSLGLEDLEVTGENQVGGLVGRIHNNGAVTGSYASGNVTGDDYVGGLVGRIHNNGAVTGSYATGSVTGDDYVGGLVGSGGTVTDSYASGNVTGGGSSGGLVGFNGRTVTGSYAAGSVTGGTAGGLVGHNAGTVTGSYATGSVTGDGSAGGLVGSNGGTVTGSYAVGSVTGESSVGGIVGFNDSGTVTDSYWNTELSGTTTLFRGVGLTTAQMYLQGSFAGFDFDGTTDSDSNAVASVWLPPVSGQRFPHLRGVSKNGQILIVPPRVVVPPTSAPFLLEHALLPPTISGQAPVFSGDDDAVATIDASTGRINLAVGVTGGEAVTMTVRRGGNGDYAPISVSQTLVVSPFGGGTGTAENPWQIRTLADLNAIRERRGESPTGANLLDDHFILMNDLDFDDYVYDLDDAEENAKGWLPIGHDTDAGSDDHQGTGFTGSFGGNGRVIRNLRIDRGGEDYVGLFGRVDGGSIVSLGLEDVKVRGNDYVGGLVGRIDNNGTVRGSYATGSVTGDDYVGGLVGYNGGGVGGSYAMGSVTGGEAVGGLVGYNGESMSVMGSYATGSVTGDRAVGGLMGWSFDIYELVAGSYWNTELSGNATSSRGVGLTTAQMYLQGSFGFDFDGTTDSDGNAVASVWLPPISGQRFPHLRGVSKNGQVLSIPPVSASSSFLLEHTFLPPTISGQAAVFTGDNDAVATIDASTGRITLSAGVTSGEEMTITVRRGGDSTYSPVTATLTFTITVSDAEETTFGIGSKGAAVHVYPNPAGDVLHIEFPGADEYGIALLTLTGQPVVDERHAGGGLRTLDLSTLKGGVYFLKIEDSEGVSNTFRIIH